jgi:ABC-type uncharacterized transport system substrate-binding protein
MPFWVALLRELVPKAKTIAMLVNPDNPHAAADTENVVAAAQATGLQPRHLDVRNDREIESAFAALARERPDILYVWPDPLFSNERSRLVTLTARNALPAIYPDRETTEAGGLMSYGASRTDAYHQAGIYTGRILRGKSQLTFLSYCRPSSSLSSTLRPPRRLAWPSRRESSPSPTK